jgi:antitoxin HigA-1
MSIRIEDLAGMDFSDVATNRRIGSIHPGEVLREEFLVPLGMSGRALAAELGVPSNRITEIAAGNRDISAETAILLGRYLKTTAEFWLGLQMAYDLEDARARMGVAA